MSCGVELPRLFVYELPASFRRGAPSTAVGFPPLIASEHSHTPEEHHHLHQAERVKGPPTSIKLLLESLPPPHCELRKTSNYALAGVFFAKALAYVCRTYEPQSADIFFVPVLHEEPGRANECLSPACSNPHVLADALRVLRNRRGISYIDARQGKDHLLLTPREGATSDSRPYGDVDFAKEPFEQSIRLALEEGAANFSWPTTRFKIQPYFHSTPFASYVHLPAMSLKAESERAAPPWRVWRQRVILASTASNLHHEGWRIGTALHISWTLFVVWADKWIFFFVGNTAL